MKAATQKTVPAKKAGGRDRQGQVRKKRAAAKKKAQPNPEHKSSGAEYSDEVFEEIFETIANSSVGTDTLCKRNKHWPSGQTVRTRIAGDEILLAKYVYARERQAQFLAEEIIEISDKKYLKHEEVAAARLRVDSRKWVASKLLPKKYGDRTDITTGGESLNNPFMEFLKMTSAKKEHENS